MSLRILHVFSSCFYAGSVANAISLSEKQISEGHKVYLISDPGKLTGKFSITPLPVSNRAILQRIRNVIFLRRFIRTNQIDIIHAHSRATSWLSYYAVKGTRVALVSTIHGRQFKHLPIRKIDVFGKRIIGICPNLIEHLKSEIKLDPNKLVFIPNGFDMELLQKYKRTRQDEKMIITYVGRFNGIKGDIILQLLTNVFPGLLQKYPSLNIQLIGGEWGNGINNIKNVFGELKNRFGERIHYGGFSDNVHQLINNTDLLIGSGRVAIEGLMHGVPVYSIGEGCCHGILTSSNIENAVQTNFGDILSEDISFQPDTKEIFSELNYFLENQSEFQTTLSHFLEIYDFRNVLPKIMQVYRYAIMRKTYRGSIPILMYHKIPDTPIESQHKTFIPKKKFIKHLQFFKLRGLTSMTFKDYRDFVNGDRAISEFPKKPFIITFDDGYEDNYRNLLPLTRKFGFKGVLFLLGDFSIMNNTWDLGENPQDNRLMSAGQKKEFADSGWEIGAHTLTHSDMTKLPDHRAIFEMKESKALLEEKLQTDIISFAYPFGIYNDQVQKMVKESGFEFGISTDTGGIFIEDDPYAIFRINMFPNESCFSLYKKTSHWYRAYYRRRRGH
ncbi:MAG: polysaccharide deacetylase family protein [Bacteroidia bacterium]|nr:polysaccharide deacetylase family protein [Bacteroidia bacterium]